MKNITKKNKVNQLVNQVNGRKLSYVNMRSRILRHTNSFKNKLP
jgi:hypothetical protein